MAGKLPDFVLIGAMRSGTSALMRQLLRHPEIAGPRLDPPRGEVHFFDREIEKGVTVAQYRQLFHGRCAGEKTPAYLFFPQCASRMARIVPDARLVAILRNPVDRAYSNYHYSLDRKLTSCTTLQDWLAAEDARERLLQGNPCDHAQYRPREHFANTGFRRGLYAQQLERFLRWYSRERLHVLIFERYVRDPAAHLQRLHAFLGLEPELPRSVAPAPAPTYPPMDPALRCALTERYRAANQRLFDLLGCSVPEWG